MIVFGLVCEMKLENSMWFCMLGVWKLLVIWV